MKSKFTKRLIALVLCMAMVLGCGTYALADEGAQEPVTTTVVEEQAEVSDIETIISDSTVNETEEILIGEIDVNEDQDADAEVSSSNVVEGLDDEVGFEDDSELIASLEENIAASDDEVVVTIDDEATNKATSSDEPVVLTKEIDGTTITLSGPASSFESGKEYTLAVTKILNTDELEAIEKEEAIDEIEGNEDIIEDSEVIEVVEEALGKVAEEKEKEVASYQVFDIKLVADGEEVQPLGPVEVKFASKNVADSVADETIETNVIHVDEKTGELQDMEAVAVETDLAIETTHFSIYVYVELAANTEITLSVEHWLDENAETVKANTIKLPNKFKGTVDELIAICLSDEAMESYSLKEICFNSPNTNKSYVFDEEKQAWCEVTEDGITEAGNSIVVITEDTQVKLIYSLESETEPDKFFKYDVEAEWKEIYKNKTADGLDEDDKTNVTLTVGGDSENLSSDIVFVIDKSSCSDYAQEELVEVFNQLVEAQKKSGATIKVALIQFNFTEHVDIPLTQLTESTDVDALLAKIVKRSGGTNMESGLRKAKEILDADVEVPAANKHVILISDGLTWIYDNNDIPHTILYKDSNGKNCAATQGYTSTRGVSYLRIPSGYTWDTYWEQIKTWVEADWHDKEERIGKYDYAIPDYLTNKGPYTTERAEEVALTFAEGKNHAVNMDRAMYDAWEAYTALEMAGYNCYANNLCTNTNYNGYHFMNMLADGKAVDFDSIRDSIIHSIAAGTTVTDYIGYDPDEKEGYDFDFVQDVEEGKDINDIIKLKVGNKEYVTTKLSTPNEGATSSYTFTAPGAETPTFTLDYYYGNGTTEERFVWTFGEEVSTFAPVSLTYQLELKEKSSLPGTHVAYTNRYAVIDPVDSDGVPGEPEQFPIPEVDYFVPLWIRILKEDASVDENNRLKDAEFALYDADGNQIDLNPSTEETLDGVKTNDDGIAEFKLEMYGTYILKETKAPEGYLLTNQEYTIIFDGTGIKLNGESVDSEIITEEGRIGGILEVTVENYPVYELPATGGPGIYLYLFAGMLLLMGGSTMIYKKRCKEVLRRR